LDHQQQFHIHYTQKPEGQVAQLNARFGRPYCPQSHKYNHAVI